MTLWTTSVVSGGWGGVILSYSCGTFSMDSILLLTLVFFHYWLAPRELAGQRFI